MKIDGGCHCGRITYEAEIQPDEVFLCHCTDCQTLSGSAYRTIGFVPEESFCLSGTPKIYIKTGESGAKRVQAFCPECGSPLYATSVGEGAKVYVIRLGTARQRRELTPKFQIWCRSGLPWLADLDAVPRVEKQMSSK